MATFVLVPGGGEGAWHWRPLEAELRERGHATVTMDLPSDPAAGLSAYTDAVVNAIGDLQDLVIVGHSLGGFTAPLVCERVDAQLLVMLTAMIPAPGESANQWWANTEHAQLDPDDDEAAAFYNGVPPELVAGSEANTQDVTDAAMAEPWPLAAWPKTPTTLLTGRHDRFFPPDFMRRIARERLGLTPEEIDGGHCLNLSHPAELATRLDQLWRQHQAGLVARHRPSWSATIPTVVQFCESPVDANERLCCGAFVAAASSVISLIAGSTGDTGTWPQTKNPGADRGDGS